nr:MAG TPA: Ssty Spin/Ssty Family [Caudoviricetes sp.]
MKMRVLAIVVVCEPMAAQTIKSAELVEYNDEEYIISFDGDEHIYTK